MKSIVIIAILISGLWAQASELKGAYQCKVRGENIKLKIYGDGNKLYAQFYEIMNKGNSERPLRLPIMNDEQGNVIMAAFSNCSSKPSQLTEGDVRIECAEKTKSGLHIKSKLTAEQIGAKSAQRVVDRVTYKVIGEGNINNVKNPGYFKVVIQYFSGKFKAEKDVLHYRLSNCKVLTEKWGS